MVRKLSKAAAGPSLPVGGALPSFLKDGQPLPRLIVFDLDYTLWPFWVDTHVYSPLKANADHSACTDKIGETFTFYRDVPSILHALNLSGVKIGVASRTHAPDLAKDMLKLLHIQPASTVLTGQDGDGQNGMAAAAAAASGGKKEKVRKAIDFFDGGMEIYPSSKIRHFEALAKKTGIPHTEMLFFDDESRNRETESLGVTFWLVRDGTTWDEVERGVTEWRRKRGLRNSVA